MKDNKLYKILRIIFLTLAIISLVFTLCKKVGLCASSVPSIEGFYPLAFPLPINGEYFGSHFDITDDVITEILSVSANSQNDCIVMHEESIAQNYIQVQVFQFDQGFTVYDHPEDIMQASFRFNVSQTSLVEYSFTTGQATLLTVYGSGWSAAMLPYQVFSALPNSEYYLPFHTYCFLYPVWSSSGSLSYQGSTYFSNWISSSSNFEDGEVTSLPSFDSLPGAVDPTDDQQTLFDKLKGWLSTISGNIHKGFKNIEENLTSFFKPYLDNIKAFYDWVTEPFDSEAASGSLEAIQAISDIRALNNVIGTAGIFNWSDVSPASRVAFTFDFGGAVLPHHQYEINFDWYTGTVKTLILSILVTFLVVGLLVTIINNIPSMIHGHSGDSGGGSN